MLAKEPLLLLDRSTSSRHYLEAAFSRASLRPKVLMEMSSVEVLKRLVELEFGLSIVPAMSVESETSRGALRAIPIAGLHGRRRVGMLTQVPPVSRAAEAFADLARSALA
jgi:DNA-binding transcriptional LysR family regulator